MICFKISLSKCRIWKERKEGKQREEEMKNDWDVLDSGVGTETYSYVINVVRTTRWIWYEKVAMIINFNFINMDMHIPDNQDEE